MTDQDKAKSKIINELTRMLNKDGIKYISYTEGDNISFTFKGYKVELTIKK